MEEKIAAKFFAQQYLGSLHTNVFDMLQDQGYFYDPLQKEIEDIVLVDLLAGLRIQSDGYEAAQVIPLLLTLFYYPLESYQRNKAVHVMHLIPARIYESSLV